MPLLGTLLLSIAGSLVARVLMSIGMSFFILQGVTLLNTALINLILEAKQTLPTDVALMLARVGFFEAISIVLGAYIASLSIVGAIDGAKKLALASG